MALLLGYGTASGVHVARVVEEEEDCQHCMLTCWLCSQRESQKVMYCQACATCNSACLLAEPRPNTKGLR